MAEALKLTGPERELIERLRTLPPQLREEVSRYIGSLDERNPVVKADPEAARDFGKPGTDPVWHIDPDEKREMDEFLRACGKAEGLMSLAGSWEMTEDEIRKMGESLRACGEAKT